MNSNIGVILSFFHVQEFLVIYCCHLYTTRSVFSFNFY